MDLLRRELLKISCCVVFFAAAFQREGVRFDEEAGSITTHTAFLSEIALIGEGALARWTRRALERRDTACRTGSPLPEPAFA